MDCWNLTVFELVIYSSIWCSASSWCRCPRQLSMVEVLHAYASTKLLGSITTAALYKLHCIGDTWRQHERGLSFLMRPTFMWINTQYNYIFLCHASAIISTIDPVLIIKIGWWYTGIGRTSSEWYVVNVIKEMCHILEFVDYIEQYNTHYDVINWIYLSRYWPFVRGKFTGHRWIPLTKAHDAELWRFLWSAPEQTVEYKILRWWFDTPSSSLWRHYNDKNVLGVQSQGYQPVAYITKELEV